MYGKSIKINRWLIPLSWLYGLGTGIRNKLFDWGILPAEEFDIPVISVGNLAVGGTGKTPHIEYLIELLQHKYRVAVLSRGYKRKSRGFVLADASSTARDIGDEPYQIKRKFPDIAVAVDANRRRGIKRLKELLPDLDVVLLDDAFQHRYVSPLASIVLTDYNRALHLDKLLPAGRLRESRHELSRADIVIVTKCPADMKPIEYNIISRWLHLFPYQHLYFTTLDYGKLQAVFPEKCTPRELDLKELPTQAGVMTLTGIANPRPMQRYIARFCTPQEELQYPDHHHFTDNDLREIARRFQTLKGETNYLITTEKDAARLRSASLDDAVAQRLYYLPIRVRFMQYAGTSFDEKILGTIYKNRRVKHPRKPV
ncbi:MAG TPA: tetraacyldisaccharide 4'-kinase [Candidatus Barnesiella merdipullorum]|nr:tetraacyldisaccharide 4'-kinase [Candidatus Barnesiella merdipullorum]